MPGRCFARGRILEKADGAGMGAMYEVEELRLGRERRSF
jgi:hypothetical protein